MEIKTKYNIGDKVIVAGKTSRPVQMVCPCCEGERRVEIKGILYPCPKCNGRGILPTEFQEVWSFAECTVEAISASVIRGETTILYNFAECSYKRVPEEYVFGSWEAAELAHADGTLAKVRLVS